MTQRTPPNSQTRRWKHYFLGLFLCQGYRRTSPYWGANGHVEEKLLLSARILKIGHGWVIQHDNGQKDTVKTTEEWLQKKKHIEVMGMAFPYPYPEEHCGGSWSFKFLSSSQETYMIKRVSIDKWAKVPPEMWVNLVTNYKKCLSNNGFSHNYWIMLCFVDQILIIYLWLIFWLIFLWKWGKL